MSAQTWTERDDKLLLSAVANLDPSWTMLSLEHFPRRTPMELQARHSELTREGAA